MPDYPRSSQMLVPKSACAAGIYQKDPEAARKYFYTAMKCLNQTYQRRKKEWETAPSPKKPSINSPFGGPREIAKWESRMNMWQKRKDHAALGDVLHKFELQLMKGAVKRYLLSYLSEYGDRNYPSFNQDKISKAEIKIINDFPDTPIADYAFECGDIIVNVLDNVQLRNR